MGEKYITTRILRVISMVSFILALFLAIVFGGCRLFGMKPYVITSGSMDPEYPVGSVVYVSSVSVKSLLPGEDITFRISENSTATHRIRDIDTEKQKVYTYGINNRDSEGNQIDDANPVEFDSIVGKVEYSLPGVGYLFILFGPVGGKLFIIGLLCFSLILDRVADYVSR